jgi:hypothetical protein
MSIFRVTVTVAIAYQGTVELEAVNEHILQGRIADAGYFEDRLQSRTADAFIEGIECLDEDPDEDEGT